MYKYKSKLKKLSPNTLEQFKSKYQGGNKSFTVRSLGTYSFTSGSGEVQQGVEGPFFYNHSNYKGYYQKETTTTLSENFEVRLTGININSATLPSNILFMGSNNNYLQLLSSGSVRVRLNDGTTTKTVSHTVTDWRTVKSIRWGTDGAQIYLQVNDEATKTTSYTINSHSVVFDKIGDKGALNFDGNFGRLEIDAAEVPLHDYDFTNPSIEIHDSISQESMVIRDYESLNWKNEEGQTYYKPTDFYFECNKHLEYFYEDLQGDTTPITVAEYMGDALAFSCVNWAMMYINMHKISGDAKWITRMTNLVTTTMANTDAAKFAAGNLTNLPYFQAPREVMQADVDGNQTGHIGWSNEWGAGNRRCELLTDAVICNWIMRVVDYILTENITFDSNTLDGWIDHCRDVLLAHDSSWFTDRYLGDPTKTDIKGSYYYPSTDTIGSWYSNPLPFNHTASAMEAGMLISKYRSVPTLDQKNVEFTEFFRNNLIENGAGYVWEYGVKSDGTSLTGNVEDINHGTYDVDYLARNLNTDELLRMSNTVPTFLTATWCAEGVDGLQDIGDPNDEPAYRTGLYRGWIDIAKTNNTPVYNLIMNHMQKYMNKSFNNFYHIPLAASSKILLEKGL